MVRVENGVDGVDVSAVALLEVSEEGEVKRCEDFVKAIEHGDDALFAELLESIPVSMEFLGHLRPLNEHEDGKSVMVGGKRDGKTVIIELERAIVVGKESGEVLIASASVGMSGRYVLAERGEGVAIVNGPDKKRVGIRSVGVREGHLTSIAPLIPSVLASEAESVERSELFGEFVDASSTCA